ncbi:MAG TPA: hypothetical protein VGR16_05565 [Thermomicrobiales bacterium]|nr:hypothetical protein [Thermomicrobiales bacterium]
MSPEEQATELLRQMNDPVLAQKRLSELVERVKQYEEKYQLDSRLIHDAIDNGQLTETLEICHWIIDYDLLTRAKAR